MVKELSYNSKLLAFDGYIARRDYIVNLLLITMVVVTLLFPYSIWLMTQMGNFIDFFTVGGIMKKAPLLLQCWVFLCTAVSCYFCISNIIRRLNDINGKVNTVINSICSILIIIAAFSMYFPMQYVCILGLINFILTMVLYFKRGKLSGQMPYDVTKQFNWGAFLGTWIWGLFNNSYIPLLYLVLSFLPCGFYFQLYCGFKGNEWAYKNKEWNDVDKFNKSQEKQATIWAVITGAFITLFMIFYIGFIFLLVGLTMTADKGTTTKIENFVNEVSQSYFESYEIEENENKFYVMPNDWNYYNYSQRIDVFGIAANMAATEREKIAKQENPNNMEYFSKYKEMPRTKIYSSTNLQLLAEYEEPHFEEDAGFLQVMKEGMKAYKFNNAE